MKPNLCYKIVLLWVVLIVINPLKNYGQDIQEIRINGNFRNVPITSFFDTLEEHYGVKVYYKTAWVDKYTINISFDDIPLLRALNSIFMNHELTYEIFQNNSIFIAPKSLDTRVNFEEINNTRIIGSPLNVGRFKSAKLSGRVLDGKNGDPLPGAVVYDINLEKGSSTGENGNFQINLPTGEHTLQISFMGFQKSTVKIRLIEDGSTDFDLFEQTHNVGEVTVVGEEADLPRSQMSMIQMSTKDIKQIPALMGEVDVLKGLTLIAGVQTVSELSSGFNVRGGNTDQNLILINGSPVFNSSHLFGFLSLINPDMVKDVRLFKGGMPAKFGERVASIMEVDFKDGNNETIHFYGGLGAINSRLTIDGPLTKNKKLTAIVGGRSSYTNWILKKIPDLELSRSVTNFYDVSGKLTYKFNQHNLVSLTGYASNDEFSTSSQSVTRYGNKLGNFKMNTRFADQLYGDLELSYSEYKYRLTDYAGGKPQESYFLDNSIVYASAGYFFKWHPHPLHSAEFGFKAVHNIISPGTVSATQEVTIIEDKKLINEKTLEWAGYIGDEYKINPRFSVSMGLRYSHFDNIGTPVVYIYDPNKPVEPENVIDSLTFSGKKVSKSYAGFEPRALMNYDLTNNTSLKVNYQRTRQYIYQLSNNAVISPAETWKAADYHLKPLISDQVALGIENKSWFKNIDFTTEVYYKRLQNLIEYKNGAQLILNDHIETALIPTEGYSYGIEISAKKEIGRLTGYMSYVYSRTMRKNDSKFDKENFWQGNYYPSIYDKPHDFSINATYNISRRWRISGNFVFISGRPVTLPELKYMYEGETLIYYSERNKYRMPPYNRFDVSLTFDENLRKKRMWKGSWTISVYNLYGRKNPYSVYYRKSIPTLDNDYRRYSLYKLSVIGIPVPSITYNFSF